MCILVTQYMAVKHFDSELFVMRWKKIYLILKNNSWQWINSHLSFHIVQTIMTSLLPGFQVIVITAQNKVVPSYYSTDYWEILLSDLWCDLTLWSFDYCLIQLQLYGNQAFNRTALSSQFWKLDWKRYPSKAFKDYTVSLYCFS